MMRSTVNFILDVVSFLNLLGLIFTGCLMKYVLPPGSGGQGRLLHGGDGNGRVVKELWSMTRHEWGSIHFYLSVVFIFLMVVHIILHWTWVKCYVRSLFQGRAKI